MVMAFMMYQSSKREDRILWMLADDKGMMCTGLRNGIAEFDPNYPPQEKPVVIGWSEFKKRWNKKDKR